MPTSSDRAPLSHGFLLPNFFGIGTAKAGTSSLHYYLGQHPEIFLTNPKETSHFSDTAQEIPGCMDYYALYDTAGDAKIRGEICHAYMTSPRTPYLLKTLLGDIKILFILRNPALRAHSLYQHNRRRGFESISSFEKALQAEHIRRCSKKFERETKHYFRNFLYFETGLYFNQVRRYLEIFPADCFFFTTLYDLKDAPVRTVQEIYEFLGVNAQFQPDLQIKNEGKQLPYMHLAAVAYRNAAERFSRSRDGGGLAARLPKRYVSLIGRAARRVVFRSGKGLDPALKADLEQQYRQDIIATTRVTGLDYDKLMAL